MDQIQIPRGDDGIEPALLSYRQVRGVLGVGKTTLAGLVRDGRLAAKMNGGKRVVLTSRGRGYIAALPDVVTGEPRS